MSRSHVRIRGAAGSANVRAVASVLALSAGLAAVPAPAETCDGSAISARFTEAARLCGPAQPRAAAAPVVVPDTSAPVSISVPGYRKRLAAAIRQVRRTGGVPTDALIVAVGRRYRIDPHLLASMVSAESGGVPTAVSNKGALGLMQVMPATARSLGVRDPRALLTDRGLALSTGAAYLKTLQRRFGNNVPLVVAAYNAGPGAVVRYRGIPRYRETRGYVGKVMSRYAEARLGGSAR